MRRFIKILTRTIFIGLQVFLGLELAYRFQLISFYDSELSFFNTEESLTQAESEPGVLILGDSFTAGFHTFANILREEEVPGLPVINAAIGGTGAFEAKVIIEDRIERFKPKHFVYQIYVGNDLINYHRPVDWGRQSLARNLYARASNYFRVVPFLNYRLGQLFAEKFDPKAANSPLESIEFDSRTYSSSERRDIGNFPNIISDQVLLEGKMQSIFAKYERKLSALLDRCAPPACQAHILLIPHKAQINDRYKNQMIQLGATFSDTEKLQAIEYPFITKLKILLDNRSSPVGLINPIAAFRSSEANQQTVFAANDLHLNRRGQEILAQLVKESLESEIGLNP